MAVIRATLVALMVSPTVAVAVTTTLANCQSACNLGEMLCLNKNASSTLCSAVQGACMAGCYASHVDCGCADASVTKCAKEFALRHLSAEVLVSLVASLSALMVVVLGKRCRRMDRHHSGTPAPSRGQSNGAAYSALGYVLYQRKDYNGAEQMYRKAIELDPSDAYARQRLADISSSNNRGCACSVQ